jgi:hypothetical protein
VIFRRSLDVPSFSDYRQYRDPCLRRDFQYRCAYCLTHEFYFCHLEPFPAKRDVASQREMCDTSQLCCAA